MTRPTPARRPARKIRFNPYWVAGCVLVLAAAAVAYGLFGTENPPRWVMRWRVNRYLEAHARNRDFTSDFQLPSAQSMKTPPPDAAARAQAAEKPGLQTGKSFHTLRDDYLERQAEAGDQRRKIQEARRELERARPKMEAQATRCAELLAQGKTNQAAALRPAVDEARAAVAAREKDLAALEKTLLALNEGQAPVVADLRAFQSVFTRQAREAAGGGAEEIEAARRAWRREQRLILEKSISYDPIYAVIGQELRVGERLLGSANPGHQRAGLRFVRQAVEDALEHAVDPWLAARLCQVHVWPGLGLVADEDPRSDLSAEHLLELGERCFREADEPANLLRNGERMLACAGSPQQADRIRLQLARTSYQQGDRRQAIRYLRQVQNTNELARVFRQYPQVAQEMGKR